MTSRGRRFPVFETLLREHDLLLSIVEKGVNLWPGNVPNDFAVLRLRERQAASQ